MAVVVWLCAASANAAGSVYTWIGENRSGEYRPVSEYRIHSGMTYSIAALQSGGAYTIVRYNGPETHALPVVVLS